ncbi:hypothetical protein GCM10023339_15050 [Alloalcanivorax gelatiniphagus]
MLGERLAGPLERRVGQWLAAEVGVDESRHVDDRVVHLAPLRAPGHAIDECGKRGVGVGEPVALDVDPRSAGQVATLRRERHGIRGDVGEE